MLILRRLVQSASNPKHQEPRVEGLYLEADRIWELLVIAAITLLTTRVK